MQIHQNLAECAPGMALSSAQAVKPRKKPWKEKDRKNETFIVSMLLAFLPVPLWCWTSTYIHHGHLESGVKNLQSTSIKDDYNWGPLWCWIPKQCMGEVYHLSSCVKLWWNWRFSTFFSVGQFADPFLGTWSLCLPEDGPFYNSKNSFYVHRHVNTGAKWLRSDCVIGKQVEAYVWLLFIFPLFIFFHYFTWTLEFGFFAICYEPKLLADLLYSFDWFIVSTESIGI